MLEKLKLSFNIGLITIKTNIDFSGNETEKNTPGTFSQSLLFGWSFRKSWLGFYSFRAIWDILTTERERNLLAALV